MCRLFGFRSLAPSAVHRSLVRAENALRIQSREHPDGWGIGWWSHADDKPRLERGIGAAHAENDFVRYAELVSSTAVIAHIRKASVGPVHLNNAHPFRWGRWLFAHNGTIAQFAAVKDRIEAEIAAPFREVATGDTDSARCFGIFLTRLANLADPHGEVPIEKVARALGETVDIVSSIADVGAKEPSSTTFLVGDGRLMLACRRGRTLFWSTHKHRCSERDTCPRFAAQKCESASTPGDAVNHLVIASERISVNDVWNEVPVEGMIGIDADLRLHRFAIEDFAPRKSATG